MMPTPPAIIQTVHAVDLDALLEAISAVESRGRDDAAGANGERGRYQMKRETWQECTSLPWDYVKDPYWSHEVARFYLVKIRTQLIRAGVDPTVLALATAFRVGVDGCLLRKWQPRSILNYSHRVYALYVAR